MRLICFAWEEIKVSTVMAWDVLSVIPALSKFIASLGMDMIYLFDPQRNLISLIGGTILAT